MRGTGSQRSDLPGTELKAWSLNLEIMQTEEGQNRAQAWEQSQEESGAGKGPHGLGAPG